MVCCCDFNLDQLAGSYESFFISGVVQTVTKDRVVYAILYRLTQYCTNARRTVCFSLCSVTNVKVFLTNVVLM